MITQEEYEEAQEIVWDYEDQLKEQGKAFDTSEETALNIDLVMLSLSFAEWIDINCIRSGAYEWTYRGDNFTKTYSTEEMLNEHKRIINSEA